MNRNFLSHYNNELHHLRQMAGEFAREFPKIAGRLALDKDASEGCPDPFVERLLEGFAFLTARVQLKIDAEFPRFTQSLLESVYPHYLCPTPAMAVVRMEPDTKNPGPPEGFRLPRGSALHSSARAGETRCEFRTAHDVHLWPLRITEGRYFIRDFAELNLPGELRGKAAFRIRLATHLGVKLNTLELDRLPVFVRGLDEIPNAIFEQIFSHRLHVVVKTSRAHGNVCHPLPPGTLKRVGLAENEALLPYSPRGFEGYRLLQEYFALHQRFLFFEFTGLREALKKCDCDEVELIIVLKEAEPRLENFVEAKSFELFCTPIVNLFPKRLDPISLLDRFSEYHVVADRTKPLDFEIYRVEEVVGHGTSDDARQVFRPFYMARDMDMESSAYFNVHRVPRVLSPREKQFGATSSYTGSEVYISLVDALAAPYRSDLQQLGLVALCTNRHLPIQIATGLEKTDFTLDLFAPVSAIRCLSGPTMPAPAHSDGEIAWRTVSHLSLNYLSLLEGQGDEGAAGLREVLKLYVDARDSRAKKQIDGIRSTSCKAIVRRVDTPGPLTFARGLEITVDFDEQAFEGTGIFVLGSILERFFARYVSLNSFTETVITTQQRGEIIRWATQPGKRHIV